MYLNDLQRAEFYTTIGLDAKKFDKHVIRKTNESSKVLFPIILDVEHPSFFPLLDECAEANDKLIQIEKRGEGFINKLPHFFILLSSLAKIYFLPAIETGYIWTKEEKHN
jgi:magnesium-protoporphyrin IX monomethyl ester (oxidative) cyclase